MLKYLRIVKAQMTQFKECKIKYIYGKKNVKAMRFAQEAFTTIENLKYQRKADSPN